MMERLPSQISLPAFIEEPYEAIVSKIKYKSLCIHNVRFENQTNETIVSGGSKIYGRLYLNIQPSGNYNILRQVLVGIKEIGPEQFVLSERKIIGKRLEGFLGVDQLQRVYESYSDYPKEFQLTAPSEPGTYQLEVCILELTGESIAHSGSSNGFFRLKEQDQEILESQDALHILWNMNEHNCKVPMGRIRVI